MKLSILAAAGLLLLTSGASAQAIGLDEVEYEDALLCASVIKDEKVIGVIRTLHESFGSGDFSEAWAAAQKNNLPPGMTKEDCELLGEFIIVFQ